MNPLKPARLLFSLGVSLLFIGLGCYLIQKDDQLSIYIGYANIIFWSALWLAVGVKLLSQLFKKNNT